MQFESEEILTYRLAKHLPGKRFIFVILSQGAEQDISLGVLISAESICCDSLNVEAGLSNRAYPSFCRFCSKQQLPLPSCPKLPHSIDVQP